MFLSSLGKRLFYIFLSSLGESVISSTVCGKVRVALILSNPIYFLSTSTESDFINNRNREYFKITKVSVPFSLCHSLISTSCPVSFVSFYCSGPD